jgi:hypothetical protein
MVNESVASNRDAGHHGIKRLVLANVEDSITKEFKAGVLQWVS